MNNQDRRYLSDESLKEEAFSSNTHSVQLLTDEVQGVPTGLEYEIPHRYHIDMMVFLPVNLETSFVYWEVTPGLLESHHVGLDRLRTKIFALDDEREEELVEFQVSTELGKFYLHFKAPMGFYNENGVFVVLLASNIFRMPNDRIEFSEDELWMDMDENTREIIRSSLQKESGGPSSRGIFEEKIIELTKLRGFSSSDLIKRGQ
jgi:hypothetical protein